MRLNEYSDICKEHKLFDLIIFNALSKWRAVVNEY